MRIVKNLLSLLVSDAVSKLVQFVALAYLARTLGTEGLGALNWVQSVVLMFAIVPNFGLNEYGILKVSPDRSPGNIAQVANDVMSFRLVAGVFAALMLAGTTALVPSFRDHQGLLLAGCALLVLSVLTFDWLYTALERQAVVGIVRSAARLLYLVAVFVFVQRADDIMAAMIVYVAGEGLFLAGVFVHARWSTPWRSSFSGFHRLRSVVAGAWPMALYIANSSVLYYVDLMILGVLLPMSEAGLYAGMIRIVSLFISVKFLVGQLLYPKIARRAAQTGGRSELEGLIAVIDRYGLLAGMALVGSLALFSKEIVLAVLGAEFVSGSWVLTILSIALFSEFGWIAYPYLLVSTNSRVYTGIMVAVGLAKVCALVLLLPVFGLVGCAVVYGASNVLVFVASMAYVRSRTVALSVTRIIVVPLATIIGSMVLGLVLEEPLTRLALWAVMMSVVALVGRGLGVRYSRSRFKEDLAVINA